MNTMPLVSVIICTYGREQVLVETLQALREQPYPQFELIVVDQTANHTAATEQYLDKAREGGAIRHLQVARPSLPHARNVGVQHARGEIVIFVDDDVVPADGFLESHVRAYTSPTVGGVAGRRLLREVRSEASIPVGRISITSEHVSNFSSESYYGDVAWASGCNMSFRRTVVNEIGGFEPGFTGSSMYEDVDFCYRLRKRGYRIVFSPYACLLHLQETAGGCGNREVKPAFYWHLIHNSVLFTLRNQPWPHLPAVLLYRLLMVLALVRNRHSLEYLRSYFTAVAAAIRTHLTSEAGEQGARPRRPKESL